MLPYLKNLASTEIFTGSPWEVSVEIPEKVYSDKKYRDEWICAPTTQHCVYSLWSGVNPRLRVNRKKDDGENPPRLMHGIALDFDAPTTPAMRDKILDRIGLPCSYIENTLTSGHWRPIFLFEKPILFASYEMAEYFCKELLILLKLTNAPGLDKSAFCNPTRYYTSSGSFVQVFEERVSHTYMLGLQEEIFRKYQWREFATQIDIPLETLSEALAAKYPRFSEWTADFKPESQGPSFWLDQSVSPKSAIIKKHGIFTFSSHASKSFYTWADLLGHDFVKTYERESMGSALQDIIRDDGTYYIRMPGGWKTHKEDEVKRYLRVALGMSDKRGEETHSPVDRALIHIGNANRVKGAGDFVYFPDGIFDTQGERFLNICQTRVVTPADCRCEWGEKGPFPWLSKFFDTFFSSEEQLPFFLSWLHRFYAGAFRLEPQLGHNVIIAGLPSTGKTLLNTKIIGDLMGGSMDAKSYLLGQDNFGGHLFSSGHWTVDDASVACDQATKRKFTESQKAMAANTSFECHNKYQRPCKVVWLGRIGITCNTDPETIRAMLPNTEMSILDKTMFFLGADRTQSNFDGVEKIIRNELPYFARYLLGYEIPSQCRADDPRFGVKTYHEQTLLQIARESSSVAPFRELLDNWRGMHFDGSDTPYWEGNTSALYVAVESVFAGSSIMRQYHLTRFQGLLEQTANSDPTVIFYSTPTGRMWRVYRDEAALHTPETPGLPDIPKTNQSKYDKKTID
jgi:hypothetical protein